MRSVRCLLCTAGLAVVALQPAGAVFAQEAVQREGRSAQRMERAEQGRRQETRDDQRQRQTRVGRITATVLDTQRIVPTGTDDEHVAAMVRTEDGRRLVVAMGAAEKIGNLDLQPQDQVRITGHMIQIRGRPLFIAHRIEANDQSVAVEHRDIRRQGLLSVSGEVLRHRDIRLPGTDQPMKVALIEREDGGRMVANLGAANRVNQLELQQGDSIRIAGHMTQIHDDPVLVAHRIESGDQSVEVQHQQLPAGERLYLTRKSGEVLQTRRVNPPGLPAMIVARIETDAGEELIANLGAAEGVREAELQEGDPVELIGHEIQLHDRPIFIAHELRSGEQRVILDHRSIQQRRAGQQRRADSVSGTIQRIKRVQPPGDIPPMVTAVIETRDGRALSTNLGPADRVDRLELATGDELTVEGRYIQIHDSPMFVAHRIRSGGEIVNVLPQQRRVGYRGVQDGQARGQQADAQQRGQRHRAATERPGGLGVWLAPNDRLPGVRILDVDPGSPAAEAGLRRGDRLMTIGDEYVDRAERVADIISRRQPGETARLVFRRNGEQRAVTTELSTRMRALEQFGRQRRFDRENDFERADEYPDAPRVRDIDTINVPDTEFYAGEEIYEEEGFYDDEFYEAPPQGDFFDYEPLEDEYEYEPFEEAGDIGEIGFGEDYEPFGPDFDYEPYGDDYEYEPFF